MERLVDKSQHIFFKKRIAKLSLQYSKALEHIFRVENASKVQIKNESNAFISIFRAERLFSTLQSSSH